MSGDYETLIITGAEQNFAQDFNQLGANGGMLLRDSL